MDVTSILIDVLLGLAAADVLLMTLNARGSFDRIYDRGYVVLSQPVVPGGAVVDVGLPKSVLHSQG